MAAANVIPMCPASSMVVSRGTLGRVARLYSLCYIRHTLCETIHENIQWSV